MCLLDPSAAANRQVRLAHTVSFRGGLTSFICSCVMSIENLKFFLVEYSRQWLGMVYVYFSIILHMRVYTENIISRLELFINLHLVLFKLFITLLPVSIELFINLHLALIKVFVNLHPVSIKLFINLQPVLIELFVSLHSVLFCLLKFRCERVIYVFLP